jgi:metal-dependent amidase/aminoacylase/carboxypeptidase family protein
MTASTGVTELTFEFHGRPAHASSDPWSGASALDGVLLTFQNVNALRQFIRDRSRIHGIITAGGDAPNIIPEYAACRFMVRSADGAERDRIANRVVGAARAAALASATTLDVSHGMQLDPVRFNTPLAQIVRSNLEREGETVNDWPALASTDFGNVSTAVPAVLFSVATWPVGTVFHTHEAAARAGEGQAFAAMSRAAEVMALSACDMFDDPDLVAQARQAHESTSV